MKKETKPAAKKATAKSPKTPKAPSPAIVKVHRPANSKKTNLSIDALDSFTREQAHKTTVEVGGKVLPCRAAKVVEVAGESCLQITVRPGSWEMT